MEEKKLKTRVNGTGKEEAVKGGGTLTYEQLNGVCSQLLQQNQQMRKKLEEMGAALSLKRIDYLFKVVENAEVFADGDFINGCVDEIKDALTPRVAAENKEAGDGGDRTEKASEA